jgi:Uma2 family endonuclease
MEALRKTVEYDTAASADIFDGESLVEARYEHIGGKEYAMSSPSARHQSILLNLAAQLSEKLSASECKPFIAPFDVFPLYDIDGGATLVQPDVFLACDKTKLKDNGYFGAPAFIVEILSSNRAHDMIVKLNLYQKAGVAEYWIVDPDENIVMTFTLDGSSYIFHSYGAESDVRSSRVPGLSVDFRRVFASAE